MVRLTSSSTASSFASIVDSIVDSTTQGTIDLNKHKQKKAGIYPCLMLAFTNYAFLRASS